MLNQALRNTSSESETTAVALTAGATAGVPETYEQPRRISTNNLETENFDELMQALDQTLPENWSKRWTQTGRVYYINHTDRTTQWEHPVNGVKDRKARTSQSSASAATGGTATGVSLAPTTSATQVEALYARRG